MRDVSDIQETVRLGRVYCPGCEPDADPLREILDVRRCDSHPLPEQGDCDGLVVSSMYLAGSAECEGPSNKAWCDFFHGGRR